MINVLMILNCHEYELLVLFVKRMNQIVKCLVNYIVVNKYFDLVNSVFFVMYFYHYLRLI